MTPRSAAKCQADAESGQGSEAKAAEALAQNPSLDPEDARLYRQPSGAAAVLLDPDDAALYQQEDVAPAASPSLDPEDAELYRGSDPVPGTLQMSCKGIELSQAVEALPSPLDDRPRGHGQCTRPPSLTLADTLGPHRTVQALERSPPAIPAQHSSRRSPPPTLCMISISPTATGRGSCCPTRGSRRRRPVARTRRLCRLMRSRHLTARQQPCRVRHWTRAGDLPLTLRTVLRLRTPAVVPSLRH